MDSASSFSFLAPAAWGRLARLAQKELRETLRDRRTIGTLVLMPLLVYPLLNVAFQKLLLSGAPGAPAYRIGLESEEQAALLRDYLTLGERILAEEAEIAAQRAAAASAATPATAGGAETAPNVQLVVGPRLADHVGDGEIDLGIELEVRAGVKLQAQLSAAIRCRLIYRRNSPNSEAALRYVEERFRAVNDRWMTENLRARGVAPIHLARFSRQAIHSDEATGFSLATLAPLILILMTVTGAVYPAIDLTAGERERGTLETLVAAPVRRMDLLVAKYVAVMTVALLTAMVNFLAMALTIAGGGLGPFLFGERGLSAGTIALVFALTVLFAAFFSAVLLAITSVARSFKEAQAYLIPLTLVSLAPGFLAFTPGLELNGALAFAPLVNMVLVARDLFQGGVDPLWLTVAVVSTALYAAAALAAAARIFGADAFLFGAEEGWSAWLRRPAKSRAAPRLGNALTCLAVLVPAYILISDWLMQFRDAPLATRLLGAAAATSLLFGVLPFVVAWVGRVSLRDGFALGGASPMGFVGALFLGLSLWPFAHEIFLVNEWLGLVSLDKEKLQPAVQLLEQLPNVPFWLVLAALAVAPAVFEELFFRGYFFGAVRAHASATRTVVITAVLFGAFHVVSSKLLVERMLPTTFLGLILGWVRARTGSVWPGMLLHVCHNGFLLTVAYHRQTVAAWGWGWEGQSHMPATWLAVAGATAAVGGVLVWLAQAPQRRASP